MIIRYEKTLQSRQGANILSIVFDFNKCSRLGCLEGTWAGSKFCRRHHPNAIAHQAELIGGIIGNKKELDNRDLSGITLSNMDFEGFSFAFCRLSGAVFNHVSFRGAQFFMCLLEDISAVNCNFDKSGMLSVIAAGSDFTNTNFTGSNLINVNFNGIKGDFAIFDESDLFSSRFITASLNNTRFRDCSLELVDFTDAKLQNTDFSYSNPNETYLTTIPGQ